MADPQNVYGFTVTTIDGREHTLSEYENKVLLVVNVASQCGLTPQYSGLEELHQRYKDQGLAVLGFPCNQFGKQEPGTEKEIATFCETRYSVTFPMFSKIEVNGDGAHPLYVYLKDALPGLMGTKAIKWNFGKFLVGRDGRPLKRFSPKTEPQELAADIEAAL